MDPNSTEGKKFNKECEKKLVSYMANNVKDKSRVEEYIDHVCNEYDDVGNMFLPEVYTHGEFTHASEAKIPIEGSPDGSDIIFLTYTEDYSSNIEVPVVTQKHAIYIKSLANCLASGIDMTGKLIHFISYDNYKKENDPTWWLLIKARERAKRIKSKNEE